VASSGRRARRSSWEFAEMSFAMRSGCSVTSTACVSLARARLAASMVRENILRRWQGWLCTRCCNGRRASAGIEGVDMGYKIGSKANNHWPEAYRLEGFLGRVREVAGVRFGLCLWSTRVAGDEHWKSLLYIDLASSYTVHRSQIPSSTSCWFSHCGP
jgi:hypothetical protein